MKSKTYGFSCNIDSELLEQIVDEHINRTDNPHQLTPADIGLGNVDNTSDLDKPVSTATKNYVKSLYVTGIKAIKTTQTKTELNNFESDDVDQAYTIGEVTLSLLNGDDEVIDSDTFLVDGVAHDFEGRAFVSDYANNIEIKNTGEIKLLAPDGTVLSEGSFPPALESVDIEATDENVNLKFNLYGNAYIKCDLTTLINFLHSKFVDKTEYESFKDDISNTVAQDSQNLVTFVQQVQRAFEQVHKTLNDTVDGFTTQLIAVKNELSNAITELDVRLENVTNSLQADLEARIEDSEDATKLYADQIGNELRNQINTVNNALQDEINKVENLINQNQTYTEERINNLNNNVNTSITDVRAAIQEARIELLAKIQEVEYLANVINTELNTVKNALEDDIKDIDVKIQAVNTRIAETELSILSKLAESKTNLESRISNVQSDLFEEIDLTKQEIKDFLEIEDEKIVSNLTAVRDYLDDKIHTERIEREAADISLLGNIENINNEIESLENNFNSKLDIVEANITNVINSSELELKEYVQAKVKEEADTRELENLNLETAINQFKYELESKLDKETETRISDDNIIRELIETEKTSILKEVNKVEQKINTANPISTITVNGQEILNKDTGVADIKLKTINNQDIVGTGNLDIFDEVKLEKYLENNIKTINGTSLLGTGNINLNTGEGSVVGQYMGGQGIKVDNEA